jgi:hypothetical protein
MRNRKSHAHARISNDSPRGPKTEGLDGGVNRIPTNGAISENFVAKAENGQIFKKGPSAVTYLLPAICYLLPGRGAVTEGA